MIIMWPSANSCIICIISLLLHYLLLVQSFFMAFFISPFLSIMQGFADGHIVIMNEQVCVLLLLLAWVGGFLHAVVQLLFVYNLPFCGPNGTDHFIGDMYPLLELACTDTYIIGLTEVVNDGAICVVNFMLLFISYGVISALPEESQSKKEAQGFIHLWLSHYCCGPVLCALYFYVCEISFYLAQ